mmetsp:Transcript_55923/g.97609  ORF Transcript_55923/g.97609 Transcript_55923/m.97609 type:complete len:506 (+) Transcript_55923:74-1591(+)
MANSCYDVLLILVFLVAALAGSVADSETCSAGGCETATGSSETETAPLSEADLASAEDADADAVRFSLMQKASPQLLQSSQNVKAYPVYPYDKMRCASPQALKTKSMTLADYDQVVASVHGLYNQLPAMCNSSYCPQSDWSGCVLRLAAHDFMDELGADGCLYLIDEDNIGLSECLYQGSYGQDLSSSYENFCSWLSLADFIVIAAEAVMNISRQRVLDEVDSTRQPVDFRASFKYGRVTNTRCPAVEGQMPNAERGCDAVDDTMLRTIGLNWAQAAALMGGHTLGEAQLKRSGYIGRWKDAVASRRFDNGYYNSMLYKGWGPDQAVFGRVDRNQWQRVDLGVDILAYGREMMLDTDMCLYFSSMDTEVPTKPLHASTVTIRDMGCKCAWVRTNGKHLEGINKYNQGIICGQPDLYPATAESLDPGHRGVPTLNTLNFTKQRAICCSMQHTDTYDPDTDCHPFGPASSDIIEYSINEESWLAAYSEAWAIATTKGYSTLVALSSA